MRPQVMRVWRQLKPTAAAIAAKRGYFAKNDWRIGIVDRGGNWQLSFLPKNCLSKLALVEMQLDAVVVDNDPAYRGLQQLLGISEEPTVRSRLFRLRSTSSDVAEGATRRSSSCWGDPRSAFNCERTKVSISSAGNRSGPEQF